MQDLNPVDSVDPLTTLSHAPSTAIRPELKIFPTPLILYQLQQLLIINLSLTLLT
jgi:hypothetical protein